MLETTDSLAVVFGSLGVTLGIASATYSRISELETKRSVLELAAVENADALESAEKVLASEQTPSIVRMIILALLKAHSRPDFGLCYATDFVHLVVRHNGGSKPAAFSAEDSTFAAAMRDLRAKDPELAQEAHRAMMGLLLTLTVIHLDRVNVFEATSEAATNPDGVFARLAKALRLDGDDGQGLSGHRHAAA